MEIKTIVRQTIIAHQEIENLLSLVRQGIEDGRFNMNLADHQDFRVLTNDMEIMLSDAVVAAMKIPVELPSNGNKQEANKEWPEPKTETLKEVKN